MTKKAHIVGWAHSPFGKLEDPDLETLMARVSGAALEHAGVDASSVDGISVGVYNNGFSKQGFEAALVALRQPALAYTPATRVENACATGSAALYTALDFIESGRGRIALVVGAEKMTAKSDDRGQRYPAQRLLPQGGGRCRRRVCGRVRSNRAELLPALRRPERRARDDRGQEPQERREQPLRADAQGFRFRVLQHAVRQEPLCRRVRCGAPIAR